LLLETASDVTVTEEFWKKAAEKNCLAILKYLAKHHGNSYSKKTALSAACKGNLECFKFLDQSGFANKKTRLYSLDKDCITYALEHGYSVDKERISTDAVTNGKLHLLKLIGVEIKEKTNNNIVETNRINSYGDGVIRDVYSLDQLIHLCEKTNAKLSYEIYFNAAERGNIDIIKYALVHGKDRIPKPASLGVYAAKSGSVECFRFVHENGFESEVIYEMWDAEIQRDAYLFSIMANSFDCLKYAFDISCPSMGWNYVLLSALHECKSRLNPALVKYFLNRVENDIDINDEIMQEASEYSTPEILELLIQQGGKINAKCCSAAALGNNLPNLAYLHQVGCKSKKKKKNQYLTSS
jgi:hypothetical protein